VSEKYHHYAPILYCCLLADFLPDSNFTTLVDFSLYPAACRGVVDYEKRLTTCQSFFMATLALEARENYALQSATKAAYKYYLDTLRIEKRSNLKVMVFYPSSVDTDIFKKAGDLRNTSSYPSVDAVADVMYFMLEQPRGIYIPELKVENF
jgi:hypothetical protein